jgi:hypothetical protein
MLEKNTMKHKQRQFDEGFRVQSATHVHRRLK